MADRHLSSQFDSELDDVAARVQALGGLVQSQVDRAVLALAQSDLDIALDVQAEEARVNAMEIDIDHELVSIMARRQPNARDLRLLIGIAKTTANLERVGDEAAKIARMAQAIIGSGAARTLPSSEIATEARLAIGLLHEALGALARLDAGAARALLQEDDRIDSEFGDFMRKLVTYMMGDPRTISASLDLLFIAKAIERVGDHAQNIAEFVVYIVEGTDLRHLPAADPAGPVAA
ncbi:MAG: phosphate signaling complex protein PhoU [Pseudomonadota bacterium]